MTRPTRLELTNLSLARGPRVLFDNLSFRVEAGQAVALMGDNGSGKTSLLRAIAGFLKPIDGAILFSASGGALDRAEAIRGETHLIGHADGLAGSRYAQAELAFASDWCGGSRVGAWNAAKALGLQRILDLQIRKLSAGQRRRLALIRLVAAPRAVWLLDEPLTALDTSTRAWLTQAMLTHLAEGGLIVAATHERLPIAATVVRVGR